VTLSNDLKNKKNANCVMMETKYQPHPVALHPPKWKKKVRKKLKICVKIPTAVNLKWSKI
jgi:hypothetical protein